MRIRSLTHSPQVALAREPPAGAPMLSAAAVAFGNASSSPGTGALLGLALRGPAPDGSCSALPAAAAAGSGAFDASQPVYVRFGEDAVVGCGLALSAAQLQAGCSSPAAVSAWASAAGLAPLLLLNASGGAPGLVAPTHVGQLGSSDPAKAWQWLAITAAAPGTTSTTWDPSTLTCSNVPAAAALEILWAQTGEAGNPQPRILAARLAWSTAAWASSSSSSSSSSSQRYSLTTTVTWTQMARIVADYVPPAPPVIPAVPSDLFYPFSTGSTSSGLVVSGAAGQAAVTLVAVAAATALALALLIGEIV